MTDTKNYIDDMMNEWTDEEVLINFGKFLDRVRIGTTFIENDDGAIVGQGISLVCGDKAVMSEPNPLDWPLMRVPVPEDMEITVQ